MRRLVNERFDGNARAFGIAVGFSQSVVSDVLAGKRSLGVPSLDRLADYCSCSIDEILGRGAADAPYLRTHPEWVEAVDAAREAHPEIALEFFDMVGGLSIPGGLPPRLDAVFVAGLAGELRGVAERARVVPGRATAPISTDTLSSPSDPAPKRVTTSNVRSIRNR